MSEVAGLIGMTPSAFCRFFKKHTGTKETFDEFYFWGEILLADFSDIDRYLVNAKDIFTNISDIKQIESIFDYLTTEQKKVLEHFNIDHYFKHISGSNLDGSKVDKNELIIT